PGASEAAVAAADGSVATLLGLLPAADPERAALLICLLVQACDATAGLVRAAASARDGRTLVDALVAETLHREPPVRATRREALADAVVGGCPAARGTTLLLDLTASAPGLDPLPFGHGPRPCPGSAQALALACGALDATSTAEGRTA
ncbi:isocitrate lyase/phosphoenolpyruvate mutase family protein, partial [Streptomyces sp. NPDC048629]